jgi:hypothetical protein
MFITRDPTWLAPVAQARIVKLSERVSVFGPWLGATQRIAFRA